MKKIIAIALCLSTSTAFAGTCAAPGTPITVGGTTVNGSSCSADNTFGGSICSGGSTFPAGNTVAIFQVQVGATNDFNLSVHPTDAGYDPAVALIGPGACGPNADCLGGGGNDANGPGGDETMPDGGAHFPANSPAGTYYAVVYSTNTGAAGCGNFTMTVGPTLPVQLQSFTVG